jgi:uncharacterized protein YndB with AHSA1/START domain
MEGTDRIKITIKASVEAALEKVWDMWTSPEHIICWNNASDDWFTPKAENDLREGGRFLFRMEARDGSMGFDFSGTYTAVKHHALIGYNIDDGRAVQITFYQADNATIVTETFEAEGGNPAELQKAGWQSILDNFKNHVENSINRN